MAKFCTNCGAGLDEAAKFCTACGTQTAAAGTQTAGETPPPPPPMPQPIPQPMPQPAPQYAPPYAPAPPPAKKKHTGLKVFLGILGGLLGFIVLIVVIASAATGSAAKKDYYEIGKDKVPSVKFVLNEKRKITSVGTSTADGVTTYKVVYEVGSAQGEEMQAYAAYLLGKDDFYIMPDENPDAFAVLARNSVDEGKRLTLTILCDNTGYAVIIVKEAGQIEPAEPNEEPNEPGYDPNNFPEGNLEDPDLGNEAWAGIWQYVDDDGSQTFHLYDDGSFESEQYGNDGSEQHMWGNYHVEAGKILFYDVSLDDVEIRDFQLTIEKPDDYTLLIEGQRFEIILEQGG